MGTERKYFGARMHSIRTGAFRPPVKQIPEYYRSMANNISTWIEIGPLVRLEENGVAKLVIASSKRSVIEVVPKCQASTMIVYEQK
jgi:hypothetical protein